MFLRFYIRTVYVTCFGSRSAMLRIQIRIDLALLDPDPHWQCRSKSSSHEKLAKWIRFYNDLKFKNGFKPITFTYDRKAWIWIRFRIRLEVHWGIRMLKVQSILNCTFYVLPNKRRTCNSHSFSFLTHFSCISCSLSSQRGWYPFCVPQS
jgi:hypothetical protein